MIQKNPLFILDGGHNPQCAEALAACIRELLPDKKIVFLYGTLADKDYPKVISHLIPFAQEFICLTPQNDRALSAVELAEYLLRQGVSAKASKTVEAGISEAIKKAGENGTVIAFGSLYLAGAIRNIVLKEGPVTSR